MPVIVCREQVHLVLLHGHEHVYQVDSQVGDGLFQVGHVDDLSVVLTDKHDMVGPEYQRDLDIYGFALATLEDGHSEFLDKEHHRHARLDAYLPVGHDTAHAVAEAQDVFRCEPGVGDVPVAQFSQVLKQERETLLAVHQDLHGTPDCDCDKRGYTEGDPERVPAEERNRNDDAGERTGEHEQEYEQGREYWLLVDMVVRENLRDGHGDGPDGAGPQGEYGGILQVVGLDMEYMDDGRCRDEQQDCRDGGLLDCRPVHELHGAYDALVVLFAAVGVDQRFCRHPDAVEEYAQLDDFVYHRENRQVVETDIVDKVNVQNGGEECE